MGIALSDMLTVFADASAASNSMRGFVMPFIGKIIVIASVAVVFFLAYGGLQLATSSGNPEKLEQAKRIIRNALIGLVIIIAAGTLTGILNSAYSASGGAPTQAVPNIVPEPQPENNGFGEAIIRGVVALIENLVKSVGKPFLDSLKFFTESTPLMANNPSVFNLWLVVVGIADVLFILVVALLGFHVMSFAALGFDEIEIKHLIPQFVFIFLLINTSIFAIDAVISLSNGMITALRAGISNTTVWSSLTDVIGKVGSSMGLATLLLMAALVILSVILLVYYVRRLIALYLGAALAPLIFLIWLLPAFKDFAHMAMKIYVTTIFVLFVHVVIYALAGSIFTGMGQANPGQPLNPIMSLVVGLGTMLTLLQANKFMSQLSYASLGMKTARQLTGQFVNAVSYLSSRRAVHVANNATNNSRRQIPQGGSKRIGRSETILLKGRSSGSAAKQNKADSGTTSKKSSGLKTGETKRLEKGGKK